MLLSFTNNAISNYTERVSTVAKATDQQILYYHCPNMIKASNMFYHTLYALHFLNEAFRVVINTNGILQNCKSINIFHL